MTWGTPELTRVSPGRCIKMQLTLQGGNHEVAAAGAVPSAGQVQVRVEAFKAHILLLRVCIRLQGELLQPQADGPGLGDWWGAGFRHRPFFTPDSKATQFSREGKKKKKKA